MWLIHVTVGFEPLEIYKYLKLRPYSNSSNALLLINCVPIVNLYSASVMTPVHGAVLTVLIGKH